MMKKTLLAMTMAAGVMLAAGTTYADTASAKIGVVNVQKVFNSSSTVSAAKKQMMSKFQSKRDELMAKQKDMSAAVSKYKRDQSVMSKTEQQAAQTKLAALQSNLMQMSSTFSQQMGIAQQKAMKKFIDQVEDATKVVAKRDGLSVVLSENAAVYADKNVDITDQVSKQFNS